MEVNAALIIIGNEILSGRTEDKNTNFLAKELSEIGINLMQVMVIPDIEKMIIDTVNDLRKKYDYVFTTGGIGPTHDDITSLSLAKAFDVELITHDDAVQKLTEFYGKDGLNEARLKMAKVPKGSILIENSVSSAPGYCMDNVYVMAGVPKIMRVMFEAIKDHLKIGDITHSMEISANTSESKIADQLAKIQNENPSIEIGSYPFAKENGYGVSVVMRGKDKNILKNVYEKVSKVLS